MAAPVAPLPTLDDLVRAVRSAALTAQRDLIATGGRRLSPPPIPPLAANDPLAAALALPPPSDAARGAARVAGVTLEIPVVIRERPGARAWSGAAPAAVPELVLLTGGFHPTEPVYTLRVEVAGDELAIRALNVDGCSLLPAARDGGAP